MYKCLKIFYKIFLNFKNILINSKFKKNLLKFIPKKLLVKYIKKIYFSKNYKSLKNILREKKILEIKLKNFLNIFNFNDKKGGNS